jgi:hypothetical protein
MRKNKGLELLSIIGSIASVLGLFFLGHYFIQITHGNDSPVITGHDNVINIEKGMSREVHPQPHITINYMRLFGAVQVPWVMGTIYYHNGGIEGGNSFDPIDSDLAVDEPLRRFFSTWKYRNAKPIKTELWDNQYGGGFINLPMCISLKGDQKAMDYLTVLDYYHNNYVGDETDEEFYKDMIASITKAAERTHSPPLSKEKRDHMWRYIETKSQHIGFLFLLIENTSNVPINDLRIKYKEFVNMAPTRWIKPPRCYGCECSNTHIDSYPKYQIVDRCLHDTADEKEKTLYSLSAGESALLLLSVYIRDKDGYPERYISNVMKPTSISFIDPNSQTLSQIAVREPRKEKAAQIPVPFGWFGQ